LVACSNPLLDKRFSPRGVVPTKVGVAVGGAVVGVGVGKAGVGVGVAVAVGVAVGVFVGGMGLKVGVGVWVGVLVGVLDVGAGASAKAFFSSTGTNIVPSSSRASWIPGYELLSTAVKYFHNTFLVLVETAYTFWSLPRKNKVPWASSRRLLLMPPPHPALATYCCFQFKEPLGLIA